ncbi:MAG TPA: hypothetical protein VNW06_06305 [Cytophagaceae bacterium]|jgi:hypothetical protein|nr:hypothetical protein [Cytophagaceae bacterium]
MYFPFHHFYQSVSRNDFLGISGAGWAALTAIATFLAVIIALFQDWIRTQWNKANLNFKINLIPPDCHKIQMISIIDGRQRTFDVIYLRILVTHLSGNPAENVEVMLTNFWQIRDDRTKEPVAHFLPMNLVWSHFQPRTHIMRVPAGLFRHCDFGFVANTGDGSILKLDTIVQPNKVEGGEVPNVIKPGKYQFELLVSGDNVKPKKKIFYLELDKNWSDNETEMLQKYIKISELL